MPRPPYNEHKCYMDNHARVNNSVSRNYNSNSGASLLSVQSAGAITTSVGEEQKAAKEHYCYQQQCFKCCFGQPVLHWGR